MQSKLDRESGTQISNAVCDTDIDQYHISYTLSLCYTKAKGSALAQIGDAILGAFALVPSSDIPNPLIPFLLIWNGAALLFS